MHEIHSRRAGQQPSGLPDADEFLQLGDYVAKLLSAAETEGLDSSPPRAPGRPTRDAPRAGEVPECVHNHPAQESQAGDDVDDIEVYKAEWLRRVCGGDSGSESRDGQQEADRSQGNGGDRLGRLAETPPERSPAGERPLRSVEPACREAGGTGRVAEEGHGERQPGRIAGRLGDDSPRWIPSGDAKRLERPAEIQALRDVANASTQNALHSSLRRQFRREAASKATVVAVSTSVAAALLALSPTWGSVLCVGAAACLAISGLWTAWLIGDWLRYRALRLV